MNINDETLRDYLLMLGPLFVLAGGVISFLGYSGHDYVDPKSKQYYSPHDVIFVGIGILVIGLYMLYRVLRMSSIGRRSKTDREP